MILWIQILRAIAVIAVIIFHFDKDILPGGFRGVDLFFVISGFVITRSIYFSIQKNSFSIANFYWNRMWRILPALSFMLIISTLWTVSFVFPSHYAIFFDALPFSTLQISNFFFLQQGDYFELGNHENPLLHTWSLSVEEQFYFIYPFIFSNCLVAAKCKDKIIRNLLFLGTISLIGYIFLEYKYLGNWSFYNFATRIWQFVAGGVTFLLSSRIKSLKKHNLLCWSILSFSIVVEILIFFSDHDRQSFEYIILTIFFTLNSALLISFGTERILCKNFVWVPFLYIGKISYSLYLFHWPILCFGKQYEDNESIILYKVLSLLTLSVLSFHFLESPIRKYGRGRRVNFNLKFFLKEAYPLHFLSLILISSLLLKNEAESSWRVLQKLSNNEVMTKKYERIFREQSIYPTGKYSTNQLLDRLNSVKNNSILLVGDSHAIALAGALSELCEETGKHFVFYCGSSFYPFNERDFYFRKKNGGNEKIDYQNEQNEFIQYIEYSHYSSLIIISIRADVYTNYALETDSYFNVGLTENQIDIDYDILAAQKVLKKDVLKFVNSARVSNKKIIFVSQPPPLSKSPNGLYIPQIFNLFTGYAQTIPNLETSKFVNDYNERLSFWDKFLTELRKSYPKTVSIIPVKELFLSPYNNNELLYRDDDHVSYAGAKLIINEIKKKIVLSK